MGHKALGDAMTDALGHRAVFSVILPATNVITEPEMSAIRVQGITNQTYRFPFPGRPKGFDDLINLMKPAISLASECQPDRVIVGFSTEFLPNGLKIASDLRSYVEDVVQLPTTLASDAVPEAIKTLSAERVGIVTPYPPETNENVYSFFTDLGYQVTNITGIAKSNKGRIDTAQVREEEVKTAMAVVDAAEVDVLVQVGSAMICSGFIASLEKTHQKSVVAVNAATYWMALRNHSIADQLKGHGALFERY